MLWFWIYDTSNNGKYLDLSCSSWAVHGSRLDFLRKGDALIAKMSTTTTAVQEEYQVWSKITSYGQEQRRAEMNSDKLVGALMVSTGKGKGRTHRSYWIAEACRRTLVNSGWCSGRYQGSHKGRRQRWSSGGEASWGRRQSRGGKGKR